MKNISYSLVRLFLLFSFYHYSYGQTIFDTVGLIRNPSFEQGHSRQSFVPPKWENFGDPTHSAVDLHSSLHGFFDVDKKAIAGEQFIGMVVRGDGTKEAIAQSFEIPLSAGNYEMELIIARSENYISHAHYANGKINFNQPVILEVIGISMNKKKAILYSTEPIESTIWQKQIVEIEVKTPISNIVLNTNFLWGDPYNGNILIDKFQIVKIE